MTDRLLALLALAFFAVFAATVPYFVPEIDLIAVIVLCVGFAAFDFWRELSRPKNGG